MTTIADLAAAMSDPDSILATLRDPQMLELGARATAALLAQNHPWDRAREVNDRNDGRGRPSACDTTARPFIPRGLAGGAPEPPRKSRNRGPFAAC